MGLRHVERLADLARLTLASGEGERLGEELSSVLDYFATLDKVDLSTSPPARESPKPGGTREDVAGPSDPDPILEGVPERKGRLVRAPRVF